MKDKRRSVSVHLLLDLQLSFRTNTMPLVELSRTPLPPCQNYHWYDHRNSYYGDYRSSAAQYLLWSYIPVQRYLSYAISVCLKTLKTFFSFLMLFLMFRSQSNWYLYRYRLLSLLDPLSTTQHIVLWSVVPSNFKRFAKVLCTTVNRKVDMAFKLI